MRKAVRKAVRGSDSMQPVKRCQQCGKVIAYEQECDYYRYIALRYCDSCAADVRRRNNANRMFRLRQEARERRELERQVTAQTSKENELLREVVRQQAARISDLETVLYRKKR
jgi:ribosome-binding protein aMBF1 (putative translation factor)